MYLAAYPLQLPEIKRVIAHYYDKIYDHNNILKDRFGVQERFIENFVPWINKGHMKFVGLKDFKYVNFIRNNRDLEKVIIKLSSKNNFSASQRCIFNLSPDLKCWRSLLKQNDSFC